jgi:protein-disulfide reductase (glutathione)
VQDGSYYPRILFMDGNEVVDTSLYNRGGNPEYKFFYPSADDLLEGMRLALAKQEHGDSL